MRNQIDSRLIHSENDRVPKQVLLLKLPVIITIGLTLAFGMTSCVLALRSRDVAGNKQYTSENVTSTGFIPSTPSVFQVQQVVDLWVDAIRGDDGDDGLTPATAFRTIQKAANIASPGTTVHILPGVYRESVRPANSGTASGHILYLAEAGAGTVTIRGSETAVSLAWTQMSADNIGLPLGVNPADIYYADLSAWDLGGSPRFVVELDGGGQVIVRLPLAREPDWQVETEWKHHEFWWAADGGSDAAGCYPPTDPNPQNCDVPSRSTTQLTDHSDDAEPMGIEPGNLTTLGDLTGATIRVLEAVPGHWLYRRTIVAHDISAGRVTLDRPCGTSLGWGSKYYVEGLPQLLDSPGEWWYDGSSGRLYLWPLKAGDPGTLNIEISRLENGFELANRSYVTLNGLTIEFFEGSAVVLNNGPSDKSYQVTVRNTTLRYANNGLWLYQVVRADAAAENVIDGFTLEDSEVAYMDTQAIMHRYWWENNAAPDSFTRSGILNTTIRRNEMHHLGFYADRSENGANFYFANQLQFESNHVHDIAHNGVQFLRSVIQSPKEYGFEPHEIKTGEILIKDNIFERACQLSMDCGGLKIWGAPPDTHVFRDLLITGNVFRDTFGWTYTAEKRGLWSGGPASDVQGMGGFGLYLDYASGVHAYRNIAYNNSHYGFMFTGAWQDGDIVYYNNIVANSLNGFRLWGEDTHRHVNTRLVNNIIINNEGVGISLSTASGDYSNLTIDHNLYYNNGWRSYAYDGIRGAGDFAVLSHLGFKKYYQTVADIQSNTTWEGRGVEGDPCFWDYDSTDHNLFEGYWPDFHLTAASENTLDRGTTVLPDSLLALLDNFEVNDSRRGDAYDIGRYEGALP